MLYLKLDFKNSSDGLGEERGSGAMCLCEIKQKIKLHLQSIYLLMDGRNHRIMIIFTCKSQQTNSETSGIFVSQLKMVFSSNIWMHWPWIQKKILMIIHQCLWFSVYDFYILSEKSILFIWHLQAYTLLIFFDISFSWSAWCFAWLEEKGFCWHLCKFTIIAHTSFVWFYCVYLLKALVSLREQELFS